MSSHALPARVVILRDGNRIALEPTTSRLEDALRKILSYTEKTVLHGPERWQAEQAGRSTVRLTEVDLYSKDHRGRIVTAFGLRHDVKRALRSLGIEVGYRAVSSHPRPGVYDFDWSAVNHYEFRHRQEEALVKLASHECGRIDCTPGYGKSFLIGVMARACRKARVYVCTKRVAVLENRIYPELVEMLPDVGLITGSKRKNTRARVVCVSAGCLDHVDPAACDLFFGDEVDELAAESYVGRLAHFTWARIFGFSASHDMRMDGRDALLKAIFGPIIFSVPYEEARDHGVVVPITVVWRAVRALQNPCDGLDGVDKLRAGVWRHAYRNDVVAEDAAAPPAGVQVLVTTQTLEHAVELKKRLPGFELVYRPSDDNVDEINRLVRRRELPKTVTPLDWPELGRLAAGFTRGEVKGVVATTVWNVGVDFKSLGRVVRAEAAGAGSGDVQIPGRASRTLEGKESAEIRDYLDEFDRGLMAKSTGRRKNYTRLGFTQVLPPRAGRVNHLSRMGD
jgi:superfamily II DNA or RNA helicase